jgi:hypothetical protein
MARVTIRTLLLLVVLLAPFSARAQIGVSVSINAPLPPPIVFSAPPEVVVLPDSNVYVVPDVEADIYFSGGWWWRPWQGRWYRSRYYDRDWAFYRAAPPPFYRRVPPGWRNDYREHRWHGQEWRHERIAHDDMQRNWRGWERDKHWQQPRQGGAMGPGPRPMEPRRGPGPAPMRGPEPMRGPGPMRGPEPMRGQGPMRGPEPMRGQGPAPGAGRGFQPGAQGAHPGGQQGGPGRGPGGGRGNDDRGGHGRR